MGKISIGMNLEAIRRHEKPFEWGVEKAAELGFEYIEPMVHWGRELMSEAAYYHTVSMWDDPYRIRRAAEKAGLKLSGIQAHGPICRPDVHGDYLKQAIRYAAECGAPVVNTDEGIKAPWTTEEEDHVLMHYMLYEAAQVAEPRGIKIGLECHAQYSRTPDGLDRIYHLVKSPALGINLDTGNAYLAGQDPVRVVGACARPARTFARQEHYHRALRGGTGQSDRHAGRLRLRQRRDQLEAGDQHRPPLPARHRALRRMRLARRCRAQYREPSCPNGVR